jgi:hypothetical protein
MPTVVLAGVDESGKRISGHHHVQVRKRTMVRQFGRWLIRQAEDVTEFCERSRRL